MKKIIFMMLVAVVGSTLARAEVIKYQCTDSGGPFPVTVDTKTNSAVSGDGSIPGRAVINSTTIVISQQAKKVFDRSIAGLARIKIQTEERVHAAC